MTERTTVIATGEIGPPGPPGGPGPPGDPGPEGPRGYGQAVFSMDGNLIIKVGTARWRVVGSLIIRNIVATVGTTPTGADVIVDVNLNGTTIFTDQSFRPTISPGSNDSGVTSPDVTNLSEGDYLTVDIDQVGSSFPGADLTVQVVLQ